ncbi:hypothetical protein OIE75_20225 [Streptomyces sp. NBC_01723]|uniref:hypothetical protein n=1 Tax=Streptomyces sp. NBC_01723 TaxID=2975921 RepID=UPI002E33E82F|nr:hypothetical protein [Streptomyces sp. NBC_01723]
MAEINDGYLPNQATGNVYVFDEERSPRLNINVAITAEVGEHPAEAAAAVAAGVAAIQDSLEESFPGITARSNPTVLIGVRQIV